MLMGRIPNRTSKRKVSDMTRPGSLEALGEFVLDVLRYDDVEQVSNIREMLNSTGSVGWRLNWSGDFTDAEIIEALRYLVRKQLVKVFQWDQTRAQIQESNTAEKLQGTWDDYWYGLTDLGRKYLTDWTPPDRVGYDEVK